MAAHFMAQGCVGARAGAIQAQYKVISGPLGRSSNTTFGFFIATLTLVILENIFSSITRLESYEALMRNDAFNCLPDIIPGQIVAPAL